MKCCELCNSPAMVYCDSDQARLCWDCDLKVHGANFLVAKHSRILLCCVCHSPTPWSATGAKLGPTITVCERCAGGENVAVDEESEAGENDEIDYDEVDFSDGDEDEEEEVVQSDDDEDNDNQVVPWSSPTLPPPPPATSSDSSSSEVSSPPGAEASSSLKRSRESSPDPSSQEDLGIRRSRGYSSAAAAEETMDDEEELTADYARPSKVQRTRSLPIQNRSSLIMDMISRIQRDVVSGDNFPAAITGVRKLCKCAEVADLDSSAF